MNLDEMIRTLSNLPGVSSWEDAVRQELSRQAAAFGCTLRVDALGNLIAEKKGAKAPRQSILLAAHMDEVGLMITHISEEGYLHFDTVGKLDRRCLIGKRVFLKGQPGVIGIKAIHLVSGEERKKAPSTDSLYIDIGAKDRAAAQARVTPGDVAYFVRDCAPFGSGLVKGPALTSRIPCAVLLSLLQQDSPVDYTAVFTVQKEVGNRGAFGSAFRISPEVCIVLDSTPSQDVPGAKGPGPKLGQGVGIALRDKGGLYDAGLSKRLLALAEANKLPAMLLTEGSPSQGGTIQQSRQGVTTASLRIPVRYENTPACVADSRDGQVALSLLQAFLSSQEV